MKYQVERGDRFSNVQVYLVKNKAQQESVHVWWSNGVARCCECSGPLTAMSRSCAHAKAVKRIAGKTPNGALSETGPEVRR
jgi:hypothetical protein